MNGQMMTNADMRLMAWMHVAILGTALMTFLTALTGLVRTYLNGRRLKRMEKNGNGVFH